MNTTDENKVTYLPLSEVAIRVLGCLIEKQHTTPNQYPLTLNSLQLASNQKTSRNPIMHVELGELGATVNHLIDNELIAKNPFSSRAEKYEQRLDRALGLTEPRLAILCTLMLRGDQTLAEIRTTTQRIYAFADNDEVKSNLEGLALRDPALAIELPKKPGAKEVRYMHLLGGEVDMAQYLSTPVSSSGVKNQPLEALQHRVEALESRLAKIEKQLNLITDE